MCVCVCVYVCVCVWLETWVSFKHVCLNNNTLGKGMNPLILPAMD